ncbi:MAG: hypothetical protein RL653_160 [Pseudomonadota bacterium]|jgi:hypothetical protein
MEALVRSAFGRGKAGAPSAKEQPAVSLGSHGETEKDVVMRVSTERHEVEFEQERCAAATLFPFRVEPLSVRSPRSRGSA